MTGPAPKPRSRGTVRATRIGSAARKPARTSSAGTSGARAEVTYQDRPWLAHYPAGVPADLDIPVVPLTRLLDDAAASFPTRVALAFLGTTLTYLELKDAVDRFAAALAGLGVRKKDRVAIILPNSPQNVIAMYAALRLGAVVVQHNPLYTETELRHQLRDCGAKVVVCLDHVYDTVARVRADTAITHVVVTSIADFLPLTTWLKLQLPFPKARSTRAMMMVTLPRGAPVEQFMSLLKTSDPARQVELDPETDLALLQYTGGTTGLSKGAMLTHHNLVSNAHMNRVWDTEAVAGQEVVLGVLPLFHAYGLTVCLHASMMLGATLVLFPRFNVERILDAIDEWQPTMLPGVPPIFRALMDSPTAAEHDLRSVRLCISGGMRLPVDVQQQFETATGGRLLEGYGLTEASASTHVHPVLAPYRAGSIGLPLPNTHCKIVALDDPTREMPFGEPGELAVKGPQVFQGYWNQHDDAGVFTVDGYLLTGDVAVMDDDGFFSIVDRKKEMIIAGGFNIYPSEVEAVILQLPGVVDAVAVGVPDRYRGETVKAYVVLAPGCELTAAQVVAHCRRGLVAYKVPKLVEFLAEIPRSVIGKVLRRELMAQERLKLEQAEESRPPAAPRARPRTAAGTTKAPVKKAPVKKAPVKKAPVKKAPVVPGESSAAKPATPRKSPTPRRRST